MRCDDAIVVYEYYIYHYVVILNNFYTLSVDND